jgi:hypothetical protein
MAPEPGDYRVAIDTLNNFSNRKMFLANSSLSFSLPVFRHIAAFVVPFAVAGEEAALEF